MKKSKASFAAVFATALLVGASGCSKATDAGIGKNLILAGDGVKQTVQDGDTAVTVRSGDVVKEDVGNGTLRRPVAPEDTNPTPVAVPAQPAPDQSKGLVFGFPAKLLNKPMQFGGVITQVSNSESEDLGQLKLTDLPPFQIVATLARDPDGKAGLFLLNCNADCASTPNQDKDPVIGLPVVAIDDAQQAALIDLTVLGAQLDFVSMLKNAGHPGLKQYDVVSAKTTAFDFSQNTLVFDIETQLTKGTEKLAITSRWYLKLGDTFDPAFTSRSPRPEAGFFQTERSDEPLIQRFNLEGNAKKGQTVKYFIKNVPARFQAAFAHAFDLWNERFTQTLGAKLYSYEFVSENDPRAAALVPGDPRYNIVEWDLKNRAPYGGLGPSIAHQYTGENFSANVLVQGPHIVKIYTAWFEAYGKATELRTLGLSAQADKVVRDTQLAVSAELSQLDARAFSVKFAGQEMRVRSQQPAYEDPIAQRDDFDVVPGGVTFDEYMSGYFTDMLAHELGHNLGLRHNFRGNLGAEDSTQKGQVSRSVMEYLGRPYRYLDGLGEYDTMAILYGYKGIAPTHADWFCTDEDGADLADATKSAECTKEDATNDPYSFWTDRLAREVNLLTAPGASAAPAWTVADMDKELTSVLTGIGVYALSAENTASKWTNFFGKAGRPANAAAVKGYVLESLRGAICGEAVESAISAKTDGEARSKTQANVDALRSRVASTLKAIYSAEELTCAKSLN